MSLFAQEPVDESDPELDVVEARLRELSGPDPAARFGIAIRRSIDEVLDGPRTGRWDFAQLEKTEKTYVGTKLEIIVRAALALERGSVLDLDIAGVPVDIKWAMDSGWQIPLEAVDRICLCIGGMKKLSMFQVSVVRCRAEYLNEGKNRDRKKTLSSTGRVAMRFLVPPAPLPLNFLSTIDPAIRAEIMAGETIQERVARLFRLLPRTPIPRDAIATVARTTGDPMRRVRSDAWAGDPLDGMRVLSAQYGNALIDVLGYPLLEKNQFMSVPEAEIDRLPEGKRLLLPDSVRRRFGFD
jgi:restriction endonuclease NaeI